MARPVLFVLAGVNGAGKSSIGGHLLARAGLTWFNPDTFARELVSEYGYGQTRANGLAWEEGARRLDVAIDTEKDFAIETTLGGKAMPAKILAATRTHDVLVWFCGLESPDMHIARVRDRVIAGGHDIPEAKIRERYVTSILNLIGLMPYVAELQVYDNSVSVAFGEPLPDPRLLLHMRAGAVVRPADARELALTPEWAKPLLEAALSLQP